MVERKTILILLVLNLFSKAGNGIKIFRYGSKHWKNHPGNWTCS